MSTRRSRHRLSLRYWLGVIFLSLCVTFVILMAVSAASPHPFLPTWEELYALLYPDAPTVTSDCRLHVIDVGNADSLLVTNGEHSLLVDAGEKGCGDTVVQYLEEQGITRLDYVLATHFHSDHIGGMTEVIQRVEIGTFLLSYMPEDATPTTKVYTNMLKALLDKDIPITEVSPGDRLTLGEAAVTVLAPLEKTNDMNDQSVVCRVDFGQTRFLLMGDAETASEQRMLDAGADLRADVLKVGHHGSSTSSGQAFLEAVSPRFAVMTCGEGNSYGHPHTETLERLDALGVDYYRSDQNGHILFTSDGTSVTVTTEK